MLITDAKTVLNQVAEKKTPLSVILWGPTGIGKSSIVKQLAKDLKYKLIDIRLSQREAVDILGMPYTAKTKILDQDFDALNHHPPEWFLRALMEGNTVLFLDELNRARPEVLQAVFELALDRRLNGHKLPDSVLIVSACNPPDARYDTVDFDDALSARFMHLHVKTNADIWLDWAKAKDENRQQNVNPFVTSFIAQNKEALNVVYKEDNDFPVEVKPCSRSWEFVSYVEELGLSDSMMRECIRGLVGPEFAQAYMASRKESDKPITLEELFRMTKEAHDPVRERIMVYAKGVDGKVRSDLLKETCKDIERSVLNDKNDECSTHKDQILDYLELIPKDIALATLKRIYRVDGWAQEIYARPVLIETMKELKKAQESGRLNTKR